MTHQTDTMSFGDALGITAEFLSEMTEIAIQIDDGIGGYLESNERDARIILEATQAVDLLRQRMMCIEQVVRNLQSVAPCDEAIPIESALDGIFLGDVRSAFVENEEAA